MEQVVKVRQGGRITIPADLRRQAGIEIGDELVVRLEKGRIVLEPRPFADEDQAWFWTEEWQTAEREADEDVRTGRVQSFDTPDELDAEAQ